MTINSIWIEIKVGGGTPIEDATREAIELADRLGCPVHFQFNDVSCWGEPGDDPERFARQFGVALKAGGAHPSCTSRDMVAYLRAKEAREGRASDPTTGQQEKP